VRRDNKVTKGDRVEHRVLVGKAEGQRLFRGRGGRWEDNIEIDLREIRWEAVDLIDVAQD